MLELMQADVEREGLDVRGRCASTWSVDVGFSGVSGKLESVPWL